MVVSVYWSEPPAWRGRGSRVLDADHITGSVSHGSHGTAPLPTEQACFLGVLPPPPPFSLFIFLVQFDCLVEVHNSFLFFGGGRGGLFP